MHGECESAIVKKVQQTFVEKGETDGRDMTGIRETDEIEPPPQVHMLCSGGMISTKNSQPLLLLPESPASDESFTLAHILENLPMS